MLVVLLSFASTTRAAVAEAKHGIVASVQPLATDAGVAVLKNGGNAVDAAIATAFTLGVVDGHNSGIYSYKYLRSLCQCPQCLPGAGTGAGSLPRP